jgi:hypothetical protein
VSILEDIARERDLIDDESRVREILLRHDRSTRIRMLVRALLDTEATPDERAVASAGRRASCGVGPTRRIASVMSACERSSMTALEIVQSLRVAYPDMEHSYVHQVLSRSQRNGGRFVRVGKHPDTLLFLYALRVTSRAAVQDAQAELHS